MSSASTACSRVSLPSMRSVARSGSSMAAVRDRTTLRRPSSRRVCPLRDRAVRLRAPLALVRLRDERGHQLAVTDRPSGGSAHRLLRNCLHRLAVEVGAVLDQLDDVEHRLARDRSNEREKCLRTETVAAIEDREAACSLLPGRGLKGRKCRVVLPSGLADSGAHHDLEDLVLAEARCPRGGDVLVGDPIGMLRNLVD